MEARVQQLQWNQTAVCVCTNHMHFVMCVCVCVLFVWDAAVSPHLCYSRQQRTSKNVCTGLEPFRAPHHASLTHKALTHRPLVSSGRTVFKLAHKRLWIKFAHKLKIHFHSAADGHLIPMTQFLLSASLEIYLCLLCSFVTREFGILETCLGDTSHRNCAFNVKSILIEKKKRKAPKCRHTVIWSTIIYVKYIIPWRWHGFADHLWFKLV